MSEKTKGFSDRHPYLSILILMLIILSMMTALNKLGGGGGFGHFDPRDGDESPAWD